MTTNQERPDLLDLDSVEHSYTAFNQPTESRNPETHVAEESFPKILGRISIQRRWLLTAHSFPCVPLMLTSTFKSEAHTDIKSILFTFQLKGKVLQANAKLSMAQSPEFSCTSTVQIMFVHILKQTLYTRGNKNSKTKKRSDI